VRFEEDQAKGRREQRRTTVT